jgi:hypothetical protein
LDFYTSEKPADRDLTLCSEFRLRNADLRPKDYLEALEAVE